MPRPRKNQSSSAELTSGQAAYVLDRLIRERRVSQSDVNRYVGEMREEISTLEARLQRLKDAAGSTAVAAGAAIVSAAAGAAAVVTGRRRGRPPGTKNARPGRPPGRRGRPPGRPAAAAAGATPAAAGASGAKKRGRRAGATAITPEQLASRQLQGRYLALVRQFPENKRAQYARIAKEKGREAAINEMQSALKK